MEGKNSAKSVHKLGIFRLEETPFLKKWNFIIVQMIFNKENNCEIFKNIFEVEKFSKISAQVGHFQTRRNTIFEKAEFYNCTNDF